MKLKSKIFLILIVLMAFICLNATSSFAYSSYYIDEETTIYLPDIPTDIQSNNILISRDNTNDFRLFVAKNNTDVWYGLNDPPRFCLMTDIDGEIYSSFDVYRCPYSCRVSPESADASSWTLYDDDYEDSYTCECFPLVITSSTSKKIYSFYNKGDENYIKADLSSLEYGTPTGINGTDSFFLTSPQGTILAPIVEKVETEKTLAQVLAVLPIVIVVVVGILAVRKAIKALLSLLRNS